MSRYLCGVDIGGTKTEACLIEYHSTTHYTVIARERISTDRLQPYTVFIERLALLIQKIFTHPQAQGREIESIGLGIPGSVDPRTRKMLQGNLQFLKNKNIPGDLLDKINKLGIFFAGKFYCDNDANCFALAESYLGAGKTWAEQNKVLPKHLCLIGITLGTGVGGGLIVNGEIIRGSRGGAGEIGHITLINPGIIAGVKSGTELGRACYCGKFGCAEQYLSGPALEQSYTSRSRIQLTAPEIFKAADRQDPHAIATIEHYRDLLVDFLSNLSNFLDPHVIVLGGGLSLQSRIYLNHGQGLADRLSKSCFLTENPPAVLQNQCGDSAGVLGAALLGLFYE